MSKTLSSLKNQAFKSEWIFAFLVFGGLLLILYPNVFTGKQLIVAQSTWELQDPVVTHMTFVPGLRTFRYELFNNHNVLWSNLRGMGQPLLANEIQAAPLFPLTLLLIGIPDPHFWNVLVLLRLLILGVFSFMIAREILKLERAGAFAFSLCFAFAVHVLRWNNHPWQNGLVAGVFYLYWAFRCVKLSSTTSRKEFLTVLLALSLGVYSMMTCGFPEAALLSAVMTLIIVGPQLIVAILDKRPIGTILYVLLVAHLVGFCLSSPQVFSMAEFLGSNPLNFRAGPGGVQFPGFDIFKFLIARVTEGPPKGPIIHFFNLCPIFLFFYGLFYTFSKKKMGVVHYSVLALGALYLTKNFPVWPAFSTYIGSLPFAKGIWFVVYFLPLFLFPFALFVGRAVDAAGSNNELDSQKPNLKSKKLRSFVLSLLLTLTLYIWCIRSTDQLSIGRAVKMSVIFLFFVGVFYKLVVDSKAFKFNRWTGLALSAILVLELTAVRPIYFLNLKDIHYRYDVGSDENPRELLPLLNKHNIPKEEIRDLSIGGLNVEYGVATIHNGPPPVVPPRQIQFLTGLYKTSPGWGANMPVIGQLTPYGWQLRGTNLYFAIGSPPEKEKNDTRDFKLLGPVGSWTMYFDRNALSRSYTASRCLFAQSSADALATLKDPIRFSLGNVVIEDLDANEQVLCKEYRSRFLKVPLNFDKGQSTSISKVHGPTILVLNDNFYPGWTARDNISGKELVVHPANLTFRAVILPENRDYQVEFQYEPAWLPLAKKLMLFSVFLLLSAVLITFVKFKKVAVLREQVA